MKIKRPLTLTLAAALLVLATLLAFAWPFLPGARGGFAGQPPAGASMPGGQVPGQGQATQGQPPSSSGQPPTFSANGGPGGPMGAPGGISGLINLRLPVRIAAGVVGGLAALLATLGLWRQKKWGMVIALLVAVGSLVATALTFLTALLGRSPWLMLVTSSTWQAVAGGAIAIGVAVLVLLPTSQKGYAAVPRERQVM
jgi:hypothetical protein